MNKAPGLKFWCIMLETILGLPKDLLLDFDILEKKATIIKKPLHTAKAGRVRN